MADRLSVAEVLALPAAVPLLDAARALGAGKTTAYEQVKAGTWPTPVIRLGSRWMVPRGALLALLQITDDPPVTRGGPPGKGGEPLASDPKANETAVTANRSVMPES